MLWFIICYLFSIFISTIRLVFIWRKDSVFFLLNTIFAANNCNMKNTLFTLITGFALLFSACSSEKKMTFGEKEALEFLYQYMPLGDSVDYTEDYYRECVHYAFLAKQEMSWGKSIPEREFKHFVVPVRVNNENLDRFRATYYEELKARVKDLSLYDAVLEVNHWCHEVLMVAIGALVRLSLPL